ncbi:hypothetical protein EVAR_37700_1 [Eumeta japonica]|uniref:Secreted protein n=1 Tax=Eumeta variegata TaxID=151549 RepID=A0A4C1XSR4_EUMVA|nr:hypothetical protein EVAR_37700_1 [Eumeta japonica]
MTFVCVRACLIAGAYACACASAWPAESKLETERGENEESRPVAIEIKKRLKAESSVRLKLESKYDPNRNKEQYGDQN